MLQHTGYFCVLLRPQVKKYIIGIDCRPRQGVLVDLRDPSFEIAAHADAPVNIHPGNTCKNGINILSIFVESLFFNDTDCLKWCQGNALGPWVCHCLVGIDYRRDQCKRINAVFL